MFWDIASFIWVIISVLFAYAFISGFISGVKNTQKDFTNSETHIDISKIKIEKPVYLPDYLKVYNGEKVDDKDKS